MNGETEMRPDAPSRPASELDRVFSSTERPSMAGGIATEGCDPRPGDALTGDRPAGVRDGELPGGRYRILGPIGRGGMGEVHHGHDTTLGRDLAVKVLLESHRGNPELAR